MVAFCSPLSLPRHNFRSAQEKCAGWRDNSAMVGRMALRMFRYRGLRFHWEASPVSRKSFHCRMLSMYDCCHLKPRLRQSRLSTFRASPQPLLLIFFFLCSYSSELMFAHSSVQPSYSGQSASLPALHIFFISKCKSFAPVFV